MVIAFGRLESFAFITLRSFLSDLHIDVVNAVANSDRSQTSSDAFRRLGKSNLLLGKDPLLAARFVAAANRFDALAKDRNRLIHGYLGEQRFEPVIYSARSDSTESWPVSRIDALTQDADALSDEITRLGHDAIRLLFPHESHGMHASRKPRAEWLHDRPS